MLRGRETGSQPTGGDVAPTWAHHHHQGAWRWYRRRPERSVGWRCWLAGGQGTHPDSQSRSLARSRRRAGRGGARRGPGGDERRQAALRHSARGPVPLVATGSLPRRRGATARVPYGGAAAASYAPGGQPARHTCHREPAGPARSASTPRAPPRYSAGCRGYPALGSARRATCGRPRSSRR